MQGANGGRAKAVSALIKQLRPDVATLDEVNVRSIFHHIVKVTGMYGYWVPGNDGYSVGVLSRFPLKDCSAYVQAPIRHAAYGCRISFRGTRWWIFGAHLYAWSESVRAQETALLISRMKTHTHSPVVLAGDLNAHTPGDPDPPQRMLAIPELRQAGFVDAFRELHSLAQDPGLTITVPPYGNWEARIDYVFHSQRARAISARVVSRVHGYPWPSDHAALLVTLAARRSG
jgi:endonuclease/exonuclease/phosphatase family metal-dependent hydrolase